MMPSAESEGFRPLRKAMSEPASRVKVQQMAVYRGPDLSAAWLKNYGSRMERDVEKQQWLPVTKMASFTKKKPPTIDEEDEEDLSSESSTGEDAVVIVDPFSTGALLAVRASELGYRVIRVLSDGDSPVASLVADGMTVDYVATVIVDGDLEKAYDKAAASLKQLPYKIHALFPGAETGVLAADEIGARLGLRGNGKDPALSKARRNKYLQGTTVAAAGVRAVGQSLVKDWSQARAFLDSWSRRGEKKSTYPFPVVVKPVESAGSDDVFKCESAEEVKTAVETIAGKVNGLGNVNDGALVQEFLRGEEYVVDSVSRDGVHKLIAIWHYDKRFVNQANFVYHGMALLDGSGAQSSPKEKELALKLQQYANSVLDALKIINGPSHMEVKVDPESQQPCLVEVGARCHGGEGSWSHIARACTGYDQVDASLYAYLDAEKFHKLSSLPPPLLKHGAELFFVSRISGMIRSVSRATKYISKLPSFAKIEWQVKEGDFAPLTVDCFTRPGSAQLIHASRDQLKLDCENIRSLEVQARPAGVPPLLDLELVCKKPIDRGTVIIVDPYSTGAILAERVRSRHRKKLLVVHSDPDSPIMNYIAAGTEIRAHATVMHSSHGCEATARDCISAARGAIVGVLPGAETGVILADQLADAFATRANPQFLSAARRNKYLMGEAVREAGVRAVRQIKANSWAQAEAFLKELEKEKDKIPVFPLVVKPIESAGSDDVFKCKSAEEVREAVELITGKINGLGNMNEGALVQEFLQGDEYVVDAVSRDGVHKIVAVWMYDKRSVNNANFVYFGMRMVDFFGTDTKMAQIAQNLADYSNKVRDALQIFDGPSHMEIKVNPTTLEPCLVEVGARCHGGEGSWLTVADACVGYNQVDVTLDAYLDPDAFDALPTIPAKLLNYGCEVFLVSHHSGTISETHVDPIRKLKSFAKLELQVQPGSKLKPTIDCFSRPGAVQLIHPDPNIVLEDCETIRQLERDGKLFTLV